MKLQTLAASLVRYAYKALRSCQGWCEPVANGVVNGWAWKPASPDEIVAVDIYCDGRFLATVLGDKFRSDLAKAKIGQGNHAFRYILPPWVLDGSDRELTVTLSGTHVAVRNSPQPVSVPLEIVIEGLEWNMLTGWIWNPWNPDAQPEFELWVDDKIVGHGKADRLREDLRAAGKGNGCHGFRIALPDALTDGEEHCLRVMLVHTGKRLTSNAKWVRAEYTGCLDGIDATQKSIVGWAWKPGTVKASVDVLLNSRHLGTASASLTRSDLGLRELSNGLVGFSFPLPEPLDPYKSYMVSAKISGTDIHLAGSPQFYVSPHGVRRTLREMQFDLNSLCQGGDTGVFARMASSSLENDPVSCEYIRQFMIPKLFEAVPREMMHVRVKQSESNGLPTNPFPRLNFSAQPVDVIVPVYRAIDATLACLNSIAAASVSCPHEVLVVIDEPASNRYAAVAEVAERHGFTLVYNTENQGFPKTVNRGMRMHTDRDVILLNSDTLVFGDWIGRLRQTAYQHSNIGTVTPLSNNATICSYPRICYNNPVTEEEARALDLRSATANANQSVEIPTAVGFCMYIRRNCLIDVGLFEEEHFGKGYGEENEFCLRATDRGWRHLLAGDTFVAHVGHVSFEHDQSAALMRINGTRLASLYPHYDQTVAAFIQTDPPRVLRRRIDIAKILETESNYMLFVTATLAGGVGRQVNDLVAALKGRGVSSLVLSIGADHQAKIQADFDSPNLTYSLDHELDDLCNDLAGLRIWHVHYQHLMNVPQRILDFANGAGIPYDYTVHDYASICPRVTLVDDSESYCREPNVTVCEKCVTLSGPHPMWKRYAEQYRTVENLRGVSQRLFSGARRVFCPNEDVRARLTRYFAGDNLVVCPPPDPMPQVTPLPAREGAPDLRVVVLGAVGPHKGFFPLLACARHAFKLRLPIHFILVGYSCDDSALAAVGNVSITGEYSEDTIFELLRQQQPDISFFPSVCPETYSYTLSIAMHVGLYPVAFEVGAIAERIRTASYGKLIPLGSSPALIVEALMEAGRIARTGPTPPAPRASYADLLADYYELEHGKPLGKPASVQL